jgi:hypothetical protein
VARKVEIELLADASGLIRGFRQAARASSQFNREISKLTRGGLAGAGFGRSVAFASSTFLGGAGLVAGMKQTIEAASDMNEQLSKSSVVFGDSAAAIEDWSKTSATSMGLAQRQAIATASSFGALFQPLGIVGAKAADQSRKLTQLGADLASFYNTDVQDALDAIRSGIVGESEPLRRYGVLLSESRVQQEALNETGKKSASQLTNQEKALARINLIFKDSTVAQGDFARTSGGLANQLRIAQAQIDNLKVTLGQALLPEVSRIVKGFNDWISQTKNQQSVLDTFKQVVGAVTGTLSTLRDIFQGMNKVTGSTKTSLELLFGALVAFKTLRLASTLLEIATNIGLIGTNAKTAAGEVGGLRAALSGGLAGGAGLLLGGGAIVATKILADRFNQAQKTMLDAQAQTFEPGSGLEKTLVPRLAAQINQMKALGRTGAQIIATLRQQLGGSLKADDLIAEAFEFRAGTNPELTKRIQGAAQQTIDTVQKTLASEAKKKGPSAKQRNTWFDQMIGRQLDRVQDLGLKSQLARLKEIADEVRKRISATGDVTRRLTLQDQLVQILRQERSVQKDITDQINQQTKAAKERAAAEKLAASQFNVPLGLEVGEARAQALGKPIRPFLLKMKAAAQRALKSGRLSLQGQLDAWNTIADVNEQLAGMAKKTTKAVSSAPAMGGSSSAAFVTGLAPAAAPASVFHIDTLHVNGVQDVGALEDELVRRAGGRPQTRRGPV